MRYFFLLTFILIYNFSFAQPPRHYTSSEVYQKLQKLNVLGSVLYLAAHPDDENTRLIAYLSNGKLYRTGYLAMTRGDGGQNLIGKEQGVALGLIRTQELLSARRIDGGEQFFTRAFDFGYSKGPEETFDIWNKNKILSDVVWVIRKFRPDVIITRFPTTGEGGHGHHTASAILASEAFEAAADSSRFPEQFQYGVDIWQPKRLMWNTFNFGAENLTSPDQFSINDGGYNPLLGMGYGEIAALSRSQHKSQGFGVSATRGSQKEYFKTIKGDRPDQSLLDGVDITWGRVGHPEIAAMVDEIIKKYSFLHPESSVPGLVELYKKINSIPDGVWRKEKLKEVKELLLDCSGFYIEAFTTRQNFVPGKEMEVTLSADNQLGTSLRLKKIQFLKNQLVWTPQLKHDTTLKKTFTVTLPNDLPISQPYWLVNPMDKGSFDVKSQLLIGKAENDPLFVHVDLDYDDVPLSYELPVRYKSTDPVKGEVYEPVFIVPGTEIKSSPSIALSLNKTPQEVTAIVDKNDPALVAKRIVRSYSDRIKRSSEGRDMFFVNEDNTAAPIEFSVETNNGVFNQYATEIDYPHIPNIKYFSNAETNLVGVDLKTDGSNAGYIAGAGDKLPDALKQIGYRVTEIDQDNFPTIDLKQFDVIVMGVRAYNVHQWLSKEHSALMDYVRNGGVLFVQYNTNTSIGPLKSQIGPYRFDISRTRVTDENAKVDFVDSNDRLLTYPNEITEKDFDGWIQERSTYHAANYEENYRSLLSMHDPDEQPDLGSLIYCDYGKGRFVYSGLVFFRELPAGVPGAYRLFANLIAKPNE